MAIGSILFAAGEGKRLRPLTEDAAKPALPLLDVPLGAWGLATLLRAAPPVVVNGSHEAAGLEKALREVCPNGWELFYEGAEGLGTGGTVAALADRMEAPVVIHNGDVLTDLDPADLLASHRARGAGITLAVRHVPCGADVRLSGGDVTGFIDRRDAPDAEGAQYLGVAVIEPEVANRISKEVPLGLGESVFAPLAERSWVAAHLHDGYALDVGTIDRYLAAARDILDGVAPRPPVPVPGDVVEGDRGRAYRGPGAIVADASLGPDAIVLRGATVADDACVERAVVWPAAIVPSGAEIRDAVWINGCSVTAPTAPPA